MGSAAKLNAPHRAGYRGTAAAVSGFLIAMCSLCNGNAVSTNGGVAGGGEKGVYLLCSLFYSAVRWDWRCPEISVRSRRRFGTCKKWKSNP